MFIFLEEDEGERKLRKKPTILLFHIIDQTEVLIQTELLFLFS